MRERMRALGLMSGTSLDGVDAAVVETDGERILGFGPSGFMAYAPAERETLRAALGQWPGGAAIPDAEATVERIHAAAIRRFEPPDIIGFHGQTLAHAPHSRGTHQVGQGARLASRVGCPVVWDFRSADVASGGEGAPLVPFFHFACARWIEAAEPVAFLNLGGVGNVTWVDPTAAVPEAPGALMAFDTGPGNALIDDFLTRRLSQSYDAGGAVAARGQVAWDLLADVADHPYLRKPPPKSLDRLDFHGFLDRVAPLPTEDGAATLAALTALCVAQGLRRFPRPVSRLIVCGGGRHNETMLSMIRQKTNLTVVRAEAVSLDGDMLEAQAFAYLAVRVLRGLPTSAPTTTGARLPVCGGRISCP